MNNDDFVLLYRDRLRFLFRILSNVFILTFPRSNFAGAIFLSLAVPPALLRRFSPEEKEFF